MTDQSRVEAVAKAMCLVDDLQFDDLSRDGRDYSLRMAQAAIEANDAWLKEQEPMLKPCPSCEQPCSIEVMECPKCGLALW